MVMRINKDLGSMGKASEVRTKENSENYHSDYLQGVKYVIV